MLRLCATQIRYAATIVTQNGSDAILHDRRYFMRLCATQRRYVTALRDTNEVCCYHCDSKWVCCILVRPNYLRDFARPKTDIMRLCLFQKMYVAIATIATQNGYAGTFCDQNICAFLRDSKHICCDYLRPRKNISTKFNRGQNISTKFDQGKTSHLAISYDATLCEPNYLCCDFVRPKVAVWRLCATQIRYVATLRDPN